MQLENRTHNAQIPHNAVKATTPSCW